MKQAKKNLFSVCKKQRFLASPTDLQSFKDFAPVVVEVLTKLDNVQTSKHQDLIAQTRQSAMGILT